jgi:hypothetical protein
MWEMGKQYMQALEKMFFPNWKKPYRFKVP